MSSSEGETPSASPDLSRRLAAEGVGAAGLVAVVVGSGIMGQRLSPDDVGLQLLYNSTATVFGLTALIWVFGPTSGAHFNPVVSAADWLLGKVGGGGAAAGALSGREVGLYSAAQVAGGIAGAVVANLMFEVPLTELSATERSGPSLWLSEVVATAGLVTLIFALARTGRGSLAAPAVGIYIGAAYWFTASTSFANPAVTIGRIFSDTFTGIAPASVPAFLAAQALGAALAVAFVHWLHPQLGARGDHSLEDVVVPHRDASGRQENQG